jgi:hypothetical protein
VSFLLQSEDWDDGRASGGRRCRIALAALVALLVIVSGALAVSLATRPAPAGPAAVRTVPLPHGAGGIVDGVPVGYQRAESGAVDAATNYLVALNSPVVLHPERLRAAEAVMAAPSYRDQLIADGDTNLRAMNSSFGLASNASFGVQVVIRYVPIAFHLDSYDGEHAAVSVWAVWVLAESGILVPQQHWLTSTILLEWTAGDWKVTGASSRPGPVPSPPQQLVLDPSSPLPDALTQYREYQHVSA